MYKTASKLKLRFSTTVGNLSVEQLWDLPLEPLDTLAVSFQEAYEKSDKKSFLVTKSKKDKELKLRFDIVLDILETKVKERDARLEEADNKMHNQKVLGLISKKQDSELENKSIKELEKMLK